MYISTKDWLNYIKRLSAIDNQAAERMQDWIRKNGFADTKALIDYAYGIATTYGEASGALSAAMYDAIAEMKGKFYPPAVPAPTPEYGEVAKTVNGILKHSQKAETVAGGVSRLVKRTGADTTLLNAERDGAQFAWVPNGDTCAFCLTLASRGWQYMSKKALKNGHAEHIHANCDCTYAIRFSNDDGVAGYDPDKYKRMYYDAEGSTPREKINSMRRAQYEANKDKINAQKKAAYADGRKQAEDITNIWKENAKKNIARVIKKPESVKLNGQIYQLEEGHVFIDHNDEERETAKLLSRATGEEVTLCPRITGKYKHVSTPDYLVGDDQKRWDRKGVNGSGKDALRDAIKKKNKKKQADYYIVDISQWEGKEESIIQQAEKLFERSNMRSVNGVALIKGDEIIKTLRRKQ